ncbi:MAG TPA: energy transducer TonB [Flavobacteriaceae bacterium]|nr:energy transducer TonB [Flavobacteriaceae bacterium]
MKIKKSPKATLENYNKLFMQLGLVLALLVVHLAIEYKTYDRVITQLGENMMVEIEEEDIPLTQRIETAPPPPAPPPSIPDKIEVVKDDKKIIETKLESTESNEKVAIKVREIVEVKEDEDVVEDVPFAIIEDVPVFPGCTGTKEQKRECLSDNISQHVNKKFNADLAQELGLSPGKKRIFVMFKIDKNGDVVDIEARAPHVRLEKEAIRVIESLPKMQPGKQRGRPVGVKYSLPITFNVE